VGDRCPSQNKFIKGTSQREGTVRNVSFKSVLGVKDLFEKAFRKDIRNRTLDRASVNQMETNQFIGENESGEKERKGELQEQGRQSDF